MDIIEIARECGAHITYIQGSGKQTAEFFMDELQQFAQRIEQPHKQRIAELEIALQKQAKAVEPAQSGWLRAIDEALVCHHIDVANADDDYATAKDKLNKLLVVVQDIGAYFAKQEQSQAVPIDSDTRRLVLELCDKVLDYSYVEDEFDVELAKQIRERLEAGE